MNKKREKLVLENLSEFCMLSKTEARFFTFGK
jgi:hypothetical protein